MQDGFGFVRVVRAIRDVRVPDKETDEMSSSSIDINLLAGLLAIPSTSGQEHGAVGYLVDWMACHGMRAYRDAAGNAVGILAGAPADAAVLRDVVLLGHIDTVPGFLPVAIRDGKLYGRGAVDAKGPLAAFATAAATIGPRPGWRIVVVGAVEEESITSRGARHAARIFSPALAVIGEPTGWQRVALGYKGRLLANVTFQRRMTHSAGPAASAAELAFAYWQHVTAAIAELNAGRSKVWEQVQSGLAGFTSADDGLIETAELRLGFRLPLSITPDQLQSLLLSRDGQAGFRFSGEESAYRADKNTPLVAAFLAAIRAAGGQPGFVLKTGTSDMNVVGPLWRCPILAYGPGDSALDHTPEEHVEIAEWERGVAVLVDALRRITSLDLESSL
jgi:LysW-gamma-L-lysine carboxypeptidase